MPCARAARRSSTLENHRPRAARSTSREPRRLERKPRDPVTMSSRASAERPRDVAAEPVQGSGMRREIPHEVPPLRSERHGHTCRLERQPRDPVTRQQSRFNAWACGARFGTRFLRFGRNDKDIIRNDKDIIRNDTRSERRTQSKSLPSRSHHSLVKLLHGSAHPLP